jgi:lysozyme family protein
MANFTTAHAITAQNEGGYANNPADKGGETYAGISRNFNPQWSGWAAVDRAKKQTLVAAKIDKILAADRALQREVHHFYETKYWQANRLGELCHQAIADKLYDIGVNMGVDRASRMLQEALNLTNQNGKAYADIDVDGIMGNITIATVNRHPNPKLLLLVLDALQGERYLTNMRNNPSQEVFANAWFNRI